jgi:hypothetical protein
MLIVVASAAQFFSFKPGDVTFASNVGLVLVARLAQNAIVEADAAKTGTRGFTFSRSGADCDHDSFRFANKMRASLHLFSWCVRSLLDSRRWYS